MSSVLAASSYFNAYQKQKASKKLTTVERERLLTDRSAYVSFLEVQLERVASACLTTEGFDGRIAQLLEKTARVDEKVVHMSRAFKMMHAYGEEQGNDFDGRIANIAARTSGIEAIVGEHREHADAHIATSREAVVSISQAQVKIQNATLSLAAQLDELRADHDGHSDVASRSVEEVAARLTHVEQRLAELDAVCARAEESRAASEAHASAALASLGDSCAAATRESSAALARSSAFEESVEMRLAELDAARARVAADAQRALEATAVELREAQSAAAAAAAEVAAANTVSADLAREAAAKAGATAEAATSAIAAVADNTAASLKATSDETGAALAALKVAAAANATVTAAAIASASSAAAARPAPPAAAAAAAPSTALSAAAFERAMRGEGGEEGNALRAHVAAFVRKSAAAEVERIIDARMGAVVDAAAKRAFERVQQQQGELRSAAPITASEWGVGGTASSVEFLDSERSARRAAEAAPSEVLASAAPPTLRLASGGAESNAALEQRVCTAEAICRQLANDSIRRAQNNRQHIVSAFAVSGRARVRSDSFVPRPRVGRRWRIRNAMCSRGCNFLPPPSSFPDSRRAWRSTFKSQSMSSRRRAPPRCGALKSNSSASTLS